MPVDPEDVRVGSEALRQHINAAGYGSFVSDDFVRQIVEVVLQAQDDLKSGTII